MRSDFLTSAFEIAAETDASRVAPHLLAEAMRLAVAAGGRVWLHAPGSTSSPQCADSRDDGGVLEAYALAACGAAAPIVLPPLPQAGAVVLMPLSADGVGPVLGGLALRGPAGSPAWPGAELLAGLALLGAQAAIALRHARRCDDEAREREAVQSALAASRAQVQALREQVDAAAEAKSAFLANMSHEFRTPMNAVLGMSQLALQTALDPRQRNYVRKLRHAAETLNGVLNDLLDYARIDSGEFELQPGPFDLDELLDQVVGLVGLEAEGKGLSLVVRLGPGLPRTVVGDRLRLAQVLAGLCGNAVKFTPAGEVVVGVEAVASAPLRIATAQADAVSLLRFTVADTGIGIDAAARQRLFAPFEQADRSAARAFRGTGMGLALSRRLVAAMGGTLDVDSEPGRGSTFAFTLPLPPAPGAPAAPVRPLAGVRLLVLAARSSVREAIAAMAAELGLDVVARDDAWDAMRDAAAAAAANEPFELALMDMPLPVIDPLACARQLVAAGVPALLLAGRGAAAATTADAIQAAMPGVPQALLAQPVLPRALHEACAHALGRPIDDPALAARAQRAVDREALRGARVLLAEDNTINQELALTLLEDAGVQVTLASDGHEAVAAVQRTRFDGVLMDCQMPGLDGYAATRRIRMLPNGHRLPILAMTANAMPGDRERALAAGMDDHLAKPIDGETLLDTLVRWLRRAGEAAAAAHPPA